MPSQTRWLCESCQREWVYAHQWDEQACPACGAATIAQVTYTPSFPGGDIPRGTPTAVRLESIVVEEQANILLSVN